MAAYAYSWKPIAGMRHAAATRRAVVLTAGETRHEIPCASVCKTPNPLCHALGTWYSRAMRYVIVIAAIAFFMAWDMVYNQGQYTDQAVSIVTHAVRFVTG